MNARPVIDLPARTAYPHRADQRVADTNEQHRPDRHDQQKLEQTNVRRQREYVEGEVVAEQRIRHSPAFGAQPCEQGDGCVAAELQAGQPPAGEHRHANGAADQIRARHLFGDLQVAVSPPQVNRAQLTQHVPQVQQDQRRADETGHDPDREHGQHPRPEDARLVQAAVPQRIGVEQRAGPPEDHDEQQRDRRPDQDAAGPTRHPQRSIPCSRSHCSRTLRISESCASVRASTRITSTG
jgi:hypothetical protein